MTNPTNTVTIASWFDIKQKMFYNEREIVRDNKSVRPNDGAQKLEYLTKAGETKVYYFADEVTRIDRSAQRELEKSKRELFKQYMAHELTATQFADAVAALDATK